MALLDDQNRVPVARAAEVDNPPFKELGKGPSPAHMLRPLLVPAHRWPP